MRDVGEEERELFISTRNEPDGVSVEVRDSGPGFAAGDLSSAFSRSSTQTKPGGLGMGLSICRSIIEAHGGRLWASANLPRGAISWLQCACSSSRRIVSGVPLLIHDVADVEF